MTVRALTPRVLAAKLAPFALFLLAALLVGPAVGTVTVDPFAAWAHRHDLAGNLDASVFFTVRLPRVLLAALTGAALALAGAAFQALLRNPLAEPFTLGVSSGGAFGAALAIKLGLGATVLGFSPVMLAALIGSGAAVSLVYWLARTRGALSPVLLALAGVTVSFFFAAEILLIFYLSDLSETHQMIRWMMGSLDVVFNVEMLRGGLISRVAMSLALAAYLAAIFTLVMLADKFNQLSLGSEIAAGRGVNVRRAQRAGYVAASLATGLAVSLAGPIGFVGLVVPHAVRFLVGPDHRLVMPASLLAGAGFLIFCDAAARSLFGAVEIPVGVLTATIGGPFFLLLLFRAKRQGNI